MRKITFGIITLSLILCVLPGCNSKEGQKEHLINPSLVTNPVTASGKKANGSLPVMTFEQTKHDFGIMMQGEKLSYTFVYTNTGGSDLLISDATSTCGCTAPDWTKTPVKPGDKGKVEVIFNSAGKTGTVSKTVKILTNAQPNTVELEITAEIYIPDKK